jgi:nucleotide-binding universal stress UspA family protein
MSALAEKVLLATDASEDATLAARIAADLSVRAGYELHIVHVLEPPPRYAYPGVTAEIYSHAFDEMRREARNLLDEQVERVRSGGAKVGDAHLEVGSPVDEILDLAAEIEVGLVVVGSKGLGPIKRLALGSVSEGVVHHATRPVLVARGGEEAWPPRRIVLGDDGSEAAREAGVLAASIGGLFGAKGILVRAYPRLPEMDLRDRESDARMVDDELRREERKLEERAAEIGKTLGSRPSVRIAVGNPAGRILDAAQDGVARNTLIAMGSRGLGRMQRMRLGSVSTKILRAAEGPVLIHPPSHSTGEGKV